MTTGTRIPKGVNDVTAATKSGVAFELSVVTSVCTNLRASSNIDMNRSININANMNMKIRMMLVCSCLRVLLHCTWQRA